MTIRRDEDLRGLREAGRVVRRCLDEMTGRVRPGVTAARLNGIAARVMARCRARAAPMLVYGFPAEVCISVNDEIVHGIPSDRQALIDCAGRAFQRAMRVTRAGAPINAIGREVEAEALGSRFTVVRDLTGHGIGRTIHEEPAVPDYEDPRARRPLTEGMVLAVEPILSMGSGATIEGTDGWTVRTADGAPVAHYEQTIIVTGDVPILLTAAA